MSRRLPTIAEEDRDRERARRESHKSEVDTLRARVAELEAERAVTNNKNTRYWLPNGDTGKNEPWVRERDLVKMRRERDALRALVDSACEQFKVLVEASKKAKIPMTNKRGIGDAMNNLRAALEKVTQNLEGKG